MNIDDFTLLLTASVDPKGMPGVSESDPHDRETTYLKSFAYYLSNHPRVRKIIFAENSGWPLDRLHEMAARANPHGKQIEILSFDCNNFPREKGKSFGELLLIEKALNESKLANSVSYIGKMTGRNLLLNLTRLLETLPRDFQLCCDIRDHSFYEMLGMPDCGHHCDSRFFLFTMPFFERYVRTVYATLPFEREYMLEGFLFDLVKQNERSERIIKRFRIEPEFSGTAGHFMKNKAKNYDSVREVMKRRIRSCSRRVAPWLHI